jgi:hypothetical protein
MSELRTSPGHVRSLDVLDLNYYMRYSDFGVAEPTLARFGAEVFGVGADVDDGLQINLGKVVPNPGAERSGRRMKKESASLRHRELHGEPGAAETGIAA